MKTWEDNRTAINELWPLFQPAAAEADLWHDDLKGLDQAVLYEAIRDVKRTKESNYPQLAWIRESYRVRKLQAPRPSKPLEKRVVVEIDKTVNDKTVEEFMALIAVSGPKDFEMIKHMVLDKVEALKIDMAPACRVLRHARRVLLGQEVNDFKIPDAA